MNDSKSAMDTRCCVVRDGDTYVFADDMTRHHPLCKSARETKAEVITRDARNGGRARNGETVQAPTSAVNARADNPETCKACAYHPSEHRCGIGGWWGTWQHTIGHHHALIADLRKERDSLRAALEGVVKHSQWYASCAEEGSVVHKTFTKARRVLEPSEPCEACGTLDMSRGYGTIPTAQRLCRVCSDALIADLRKERDSLRAENERLFTHAKSWRDYCESHSSTCSEEETALVIEFYRIEQARHAFKGAK